MTKNSSDTCANQDIINESLSALCDGEANDMDLRRVLNDVDNGDVYQNCIVIKPSKML